MDCVVTASKDQLASSVGGETVILGLTTGRYYGVDAVGARIWQLLQSPMRVDAIRDTIVAEYDVEKERCETDLLRLLEDMRRSGLVEVQPGS